MLKAMFGGHPLLANVDNTHEHRRNYKSSRGADLPLIVEQRRYDALPNSDRPFFITGTNSVNINCPAVSGLFNRLRWLEWMLKYLSPWARPDSASDCRLNKVCKWS